jgi:hypothetical protein
VLEAVPELVKQRGQLAKGHERRLAVHRWGLVAVQVGHRELGSSTLPGQQTASAHALGHPGSSTLLPGSSVRVEVKRGDRLLFLVEDPKKPDVLIPDRRIAVGRYHLYVKDALRELKQAREYTGEGKIGTQVLIAVSEEVLPVLLGPVREVPVTQ